MIKMKVEKNIKFPKIDIDKDIAVVANKIVIPLLTHGIDSNTDINGNKHPDLEPTTIRRKHHSRPLIDTGALRKSFKHRKISENKHIVFINAFRNKVGEYLQIDGVGKKKKHFKFMATTDKMEKESMIYIKDKIKAITQRFNRNGR